MSAIKKDQGKAPVVQGFMLYFPRAIKAVSLASKAGLEKYNLEYEDKNFMGLDPARLHDADGRHILDEAIDGMYDPETKLIHAALHAWEAMARLEILLRDGCPVYEPVPVDVFKEAQDYANEVLLKTNDELANLSQEVFKIPSLAQMTAQMTGHIDYAKTSPPPADKGVGAGVIETGETFFQDDDKKLFSEEFERIVFGPINPAYRSRNCYQVGIDGCERITGRKVGNEDGMDIYVYDIQFTTGGTITVDNTLLVSDQG